MNSFARPAFLTLVSLTFGIGTAAAQVYLPGMQPEHSGLRLESVRTCESCHSRTANGPHDPFASWQGGMMALATRDPVFRAAMSIANQDIPGVGDFCLRCHTPHGFFGGRTMPADASGLEPQDMDGVTCTLCHRLVDPRTPEAAALIEKTPPGLGNAMMAVDPAYVMRGPYDDGTRVRMRPHGVLKSPFLASGDLCGTCHDVSNPTHASDVKTQPPYAFGHIERTYSEWALSEFARQGPTGSCQHCHYPAIDGGGHPDALQEQPEARALRRSRPGGRVPRGCRTRDLGAVVRRGYEPRRA